jgi:predicted nucleic acid-binding protein
MITGLTGKKQTTMNKIALDSNIVLYNHDNNINHARKKATAARLLDENPVISSQVISEYFNVMQKKHNVEKTALIRVSVLWLEKCHIQPVTLTTVKTASRLIDRYKFQLFDSLIVAAAVEAQCDILYSEDMQHNQIINDTLKIINPFVDER